MFQLSWWKYVCIILMYYTIVAGFLMPAPDKYIVHDSIRNLYFHVPMWFGMTLLLLASLIFSLRYLIYHKIEDDFKAVSAARVGLLFGICGILTGMQWARVAWGAWWNNDPKETDAAIGLLMYFAYFVLRSSTDDIDKRARISAVTNVMLYAIFIPIIFIVPRLTDSLHPGNGGNPGFNEYDLDGKMKLVFRPAVIAWTMLGFWIAEISYRTMRANYNLRLSEMNP